MTHGLNLGSFKNSVSNRVDQQLNHLLTPSCALAPGLVQAMDYATLGGGKRVRPLLCFASARLFDRDCIDNEAVLSAACAVELIHAYSLVHDDLPAMDDDDLRRGRPATHKKFDEATAILAGDALQSLAFEVLSKSEMPAEVRVRSISLLADASGHMGMAGGQMIDLNAVGNDLDTDALVKMHSMKTGALIRASVVLGALASGCTDAEQLNALGAYANKIGLVFQIQDDILDCTSTTAELGKQQGADAERGKPTCVSLLGLDGAREKLQLAHGQAMGALHGISVEENSLLGQIADYIVDRKR